MQLVKSAQTAIRVAGAVLSGAIAMAGSASAQEPIRIGAAFLAETGPAAFLGDPAQIPFISLAGAVVIIEPVKK